MKAWQDVTGGGPRPTGDVHGASTTNITRPPKGGRGADEYLAELIEEGGEPVVEVSTRPEPPLLQWVSLENKLRRADELVDMAAEIQGDPLTGTLIKVNEDFRGFRDLIKSFADEFGASDEAVIRKVVEVMREWIEMQLLEVVMTVRNLEDGKIWTKDKVAQALTPEALTGN